jgi:predicted nuclease of restriction endonuclease-like (RecB) superfamily
MAIKKPVAATSSPKGDFELLVTSIVQIHRQSNAFAVKAVNIGLTLRNWLIGYRIVEFEQMGRDRAAYGAQLLQSLANSLKSAGLTRVDARESRRFRLLYAVYPQIRETATPESAPPKAEILVRPSFSHLAELLELEHDTQRRFYEFECIRGNWSVRELRRQIASLYYERSGLSRNKEKLSAMSQAGADVFQPTHIIRDPYIFEFLGLRSKDVMGESNSASSRSDRLQESLLEMGHDIVEFEQGGGTPADYGKALLTNLSRDLSVQHCKGFSRSNVIYKSLLYLQYAKGQKPSDLLSWSGDGIMQRRFSTKGAQYDSPGHRPGFVSTEKLRALKGRHKTRFALSGLDGFLAVEPRAMPWAITLRPVGAWHNWCAESLSLERAIQANLRGLGYEAMTPTRNPRSI